MPAGREVQTMDENVVPLRPKVSDDELQQAVKQAFETARGQWEEAVRVLKAVRNLRLGRRVIAPLGRAVVEAKARLLSVYHHPANWVGGVAKNQLPRDFTRMIAHQIDTMVAGKMPEPVQDCVAAHRPSAPPQERNDVCLAVYYVEGAKSGQIQDQTPIKTVMKAFGVVERTVWYWTRKYRGFDLDAGLRYLPPGETLAQHLTRLMEEAGRRYRAAHRSKAPRVHHGKRGRACRR
jgi:hypothetical protein